jgi:hypothetical protein
MDAITDLVLLPPAWQVGTVSSPNGARNAAAQHPVLSWLIDCATGRPTARWVIVSADGAIANGLS